MSALRAGNRIQIARPWLKKATSEEGDEQEEEDPFGRKSSSKASPFKSRPWQRTANEEEEEVKAALLAHDRRRQVLRRLQEDLDEGLFTRGKVSAMKRRIHLARNGGSDGITDEEEEESVA